MKRETYIQMTQPFRDNPRMARGIHMVNKLCTGSMYLAYPLLVLYLLWEEVSSAGMTGAILHPFMVLMGAESLGPLSRVILVPAISFVVLSVFRYVLNRPRPYEQFDIVSVIKKDTKGKSFPSRHVFSAMMIALSYLLISPWPWLGFIFVVLSAALAVVRVVSGVHFISDVVAGILFAIIAAVVGYVVL